MQCTTEYHTPNTECILQKGKTVAVTTKAEVLQTALMFSLPKLYDFRNSIGAILCQLCRFSESETIWNSKER